MIKRLILADLAAMTVCLTVWRSMQLFLFSAVMQNGNWSFWLRRIWWNPENLCWMTGAIS